MITHIVHIIIPIILGVIIGSILQFITNRYRRIRYYKEYIEGKHGKRR